MGAVAAISAGAGLASSFMGANAQSAGADGYADAISGAADQAAAISAENLKRQLGTLKGTTADARNDLTNYLALQNFNPNLSQTQPYNLSGYNALDMVNVALGLPTAKGGSFGLAQKLNEAQQAQQDKQRIGDLFQSAVIADPMGSKRLDGKSNLYDDNRIWKDEQYTADVGHTITSIASQLVQKIGQSGEDSLTPEQKSFLSMYQATGGGAGMTGDQFLGRFKKFDQAQQDFMDKYNKGEIEYEDQATGAAQGQKLQDLVRNTPGYQFAVDSANRGIEASAAAKGMTLSSNNLEALNQTNQNMADTQYNTILNNLMSMAGMGQQTATGNQATTNSMQLAKNNALANTGTQLAQTNLNLGQQNAQYMGVDASNRGNAALTKGQAQGTAALAKGQIQSDMYSNMGSVLTKGLSGFGGGGAGMTNTGITRSV